MALVLPDRVKETATTAGTGTFTLAGAVAKFQSFSAVGNGNTTYYCIQHETENEFEVGLGTYTASGTTLSRDTILTSTNSNNAVNFSAGDKTVFVVVPGDKTIRKDGSGAANITSSDVTTALGFTPISSADGGNADTLDGIDSTGFVRQLSTATSPDYQTPSSRRVDPNSGNPTNEHYAITTFGNGSNVTGQIAAHFQTGQLYSRGYNSSFSSWRKIWNDANDGSGSGLDADTLDGIQGSSFLRSDTDDSTSGKLNVGTNSTLSSTGQLNIYRSANPYIGWYSGSTSRGAYLQYVGSGDYFFFGHVSYSESEGSFRAPIFYDSNDTNYHVNAASTSYFAYLGRRAHQTGHLVGGHNNIGSTATASSPIYTIGSSYNPNQSSLGNMYGIGYSHTNASFIGFAGSVGWGMYVAADGDARVYLSGQSGTGHFTGNITAYASDERLKTNIKPVENALDKVCQLRGVEFDWVDNITSEYDFHPQTMHETGVIAQNVAEHIPDAVCEAPMNGNYTAKSGTDHKFLTVDKEKIIPVLIEAIKELKAEIDMLKGEADV
jgi:hypothetical protein